MSEWYQRQFGDRGEFAISISLGVDPYASGQVERDLTWGTLEVWAKNRCLTASVCDGNMSRGVRWNLLPVLEWFLEVGVRLVNEDPYPRFSKGRDVSDGATWYDATLSPPVLTPEEERKWFLRRSEWRHHHSLRRAAEDVALPNIVFRRLAQCVEVSWDNDAWAAPRPDLYFVEKRGRALVAAEVFGAVVRDALTEVTSSLAQRTENPGLVALADAAVAFKAAREDWRWLVHRPTAQVIRDHLPELRDRLEEATTSGAVGIYVPHTPETLVLRHVRLNRKADVESVLRAARQLPEQSMADPLGKLVRPGPAASERPWEEGNEYAEAVRDALGWGTEPLPDLADWMTRQRVLVPPEDLGLPPAVAVLCRRTEDLCAMTHVNPRGESRMKIETGLATALGHVLLDDSSVSIDGDWEHWPTSARARAFGVALTLPEDGVRDAIGGTTAVGVDEVREVMRRFRAGPWATTFRMKNLGLITPDEQMELTYAVS